MDWRGRGTPRIYCPQCRIVLEKWAKQFDLSYDEFNECAIDIDSICTDDIKGTDE
jgi:hypothetical protein